MSKLREIIGKYTAGEATLEATNRALEDAGAGFHLNPGKNILTEAEKRATTVGYYPEQANGYGLLDTGTGSLDKVEVRNGKLANMDCGDMHALCIIGGKVYQVKGDTLTD